ncbi:NfeD family protein [Polymorphobacter fuscus]|uniref:NfeD family protein n=1 Tax=Sandarakinorhabdus fusca TaxID=1439888 RepID=A0A7C9KW90_9SPHN|nr:NfeD family protein [Polymorphobacter fuscus]KAB7648240.1 NfeD family protein [Polymorphobacter fuscus]MQT15746.1 NfeD family protein [Polymorphobacter fuscus]NJC07983.1 hypothetical protein [Polymorphobacter fuscus]
MIALINPWGWAILAAILAGAEMAVPGVFMIWLAGGAAATAIVSAVFDIGWEAQLVIFAAFSILAVIIGRSLFGEDVSQPADPALNRRGERLLGTSVTVTEALHNGRGRVQVGDSAWAAEGPDLPVGARARITGIEGATLHVEPD